MKENKKADAFLKLIGIIGGRQVGPHREAKELIEIIVSPAEWLLLITWASAEMSSSKKSFLMTYLGYLLKPDTPLHHRVYFLLFGL